MRGRLPGAIDPLGRFPEVGFLCGSDLHEGLRIAIDQGEPGALDLDHDRVAGPECVRDVLETEADRSWLVGHEWLGRGKTVAKPATHHIAADKLLVATQWNRWAPDAGSREVGGVNVNQLDDPVGIRSGRRDKKTNLNRSHQRQVPFQRGGLVDQHVGPARGEPLILDHVVAVHPLGDLIDKFHGP